MEVPKKTPYELVFGKLAIIPSDQFLHPYEKIETYKDYLIRLMSRLDKLHTDNRDNLEKEKQRSRTYYDRKTKLENLEAGDYVFLRKGLRTSKLNDVNEGPYKIILIMNDENVKRRIGRKEKIVSTDRLIQSNIIEYSD